MSTTIREVLIKVGLQTDASGFKVPDFSKSASGLKDVTKLSDDFDKKLKQILKDTENLKSSEEEHIARLKDAAEQTRKVADFESQRAEALSSLANGTLKVARGVAFMTAANEEEYQVMLKTIAQAQGYFDLMTGMIEVYKAVANAKKIYAAATYAEAAANLAAAGSGGSSAASGAAGGLAAGVAGRAIGARGALVAAGAAVATPITLTAGAIATAGYFAGDYLLGEFSGSKEQRRQDTAQAARWDSFAKNRKGVVGQSVGEIDRFTEQFGGRYEQERAFRTASMAGGYLNTDQAMAGIDKSLMTANRGLAASMKQTDIGSPITSGVELMMKQKAATDNIVSAEKERQEVIRGQVDGLRSQLQVAQQIQETAKQTLQTEEERFRSMESRAGRLSGQDSARLKAISDKVKSGQEISTSEASFLDRTGFGKDIADARFRKQVQERGDTGSLQGLGEDRNLKAAQAGVVSARNAAGLAADELAAEIEKYTEQQKSSSDRMIKAMEASLARQKEIDARVAAIEKGFMDIGRGQHQRRAAGGPVF